MSVGLLASPLRHPTKETLASVTKKLQNIRVGEKKGWRKTFHKGAYLNSTKLSHKKRYLLYRITVLAEKEMFPFWS